MVSRNTTLVPSLGLRIGPACKASLSAGIRRERVPPRIRKKEKKEDGVSRTFGAENHSFQCCVKKPET